MRNISLINIGNELLKGRIVNSNAADAGAMLRREGFALHRTLVIPDDQAVIAAAIEAELGQSDVVIMSGGLGPTRDDLTKDVLAQWFGAPLVPHAPTIAWLEQRYADRGRVLTETNRRQGWVPEGCVVLPNRMGTAPGMLFHKDGKLLFSLPGVPFEMRYLLEHEVIPQLKVAFPPTFFTYRILRLAGIPESHVADRMRGIEDGLSPLVEIAYLPRRDGVWIELSLSIAPAQQEKALAALLDAEEQVARLFADKLYARGEESVSALMGKALGERGLKLAVAESLTGGLLADEVVQSSGSSGYFKGGVIAYDVEVKKALLGVPAALIEAHGVVSAEVAIAMAEGVRRLLGADVALATTGIAEAGPDTGERPHAWIAYADARGSKAREVELYHSRNLNRERAAIYALVMGIKQLSPPSIP